mgnify:CR=1 FL=1
MTDDLMSMAKTEDISDLSYCQQLVPGIKSQESLEHYQQADYMFRTLGAKAKKQYRRIQDKLAEWARHKASLAPELSAFVKATGESKVQAAGHTTYKITTLLGTTYTRKDTDWRLKIDDENSALDWATLEGILEEGDTETTVKLTAQGKKRIRDHVIGLVEEGAEINIPDGATLYPPRPSVATKLDGAPRLTELRKLDEEIMRKQAAITNPIEHLENKDNNHEQRIREST